MTKTEKSASPEKLKLYIRRTIPFHSFVILSLWFSFFYDKSPSLGDLATLISLASFAIFSAWGGYIIAKYDIIDQANSRISNKFIREFISISIGISCLFWTAIAGLLVGFLFFFVSNHIFM